MDGKARQPLIAIASARFAERNDHVVRAHLELCAKRAEVFGMSLTMSGALEG